MDSLHVFAGYVGLLCWLGYCVRRDYQVFRDCVDLDYFIMPFGVTLLTLGNLVIFVESIEKRYKEKYAHMSGMWETRAAATFGLLFGIGLWVFVFPAETFWYMLRFSANCRHQTSTWHLICYWLLSVYAIISWFMLVVSFVLSVREPTLNALMTKFRILTGSESKRYKLMKQKLKQNIGTEDGLRLFLTDFQEIKRSLIEGGWLNQRPKAFCFDDLTIDYSIYFSSWLVPSPEDDHLLYEFLQIRGCLVCDQANWHKHREWRQSRLTILVCGHIGHDCCISKMMRAVAHCTRCRANLDPIRYLTEESKRPGCLTIETLSLLQQSSDPQNFTPEYREALQILLSGETQ